MKKKVTWRDDLKKGYIKKYQPSYNTKKKRKLKQTLDTDIIRNEKIIELILKEQYQVLYNTLQNLTLSMDNISEKTEYLYNLLVHQDNSPLTASIQTLKIPAIELIKQLISNEYFKKSIEVDNIINTLLGQIQYRDKYSEYTKYRDKFITIVNIFASVVGKDAIVNILNSTPLKISDEVKADLLDIINNAVNTDESITYKNTNYQILSR